MEEAEGFLGEYHSTVDQSRTKLRDAGISSNRTRMLSPNNHVVGVSHLGALHTHESPALESRRRSTLQDSSSLSLGKKREAERVEEGIDTLGSKVDFKSAREQRKETFPSFSLVGSC